MGKQDRIKDMEAEINKTQYNKATQHHVGLLKARIAKLKDEIEQQKKGKGKHEGYNVRRTGDATIVMVGFPSVGKSTLLNRLTNANSKVAAYEFTTLDVIPGLLEYNHAKLQVLDVPGIVQGAADGTGRGREVLAAVRSADMILLILDINQMHHLKIIQNEVYKSGLRMNQKKPDVVIRKTPRGGIAIASTVALEIDRQTIVGVMNEFRINNADILIRSPINVDQLIDCIEGNKKYLPGLMVINKIDMVPKETVDAAMKQFPDAVPVSANEGINMELLKKRIYERLDFINIYLKEPGKQPDLDEPMIIPNGSTIKDICDKLHRDFSMKFKYARIWGKSVKYDGQKITKLGKDVMDKDVVELHIR